MIGELGRERLDADFAKMHSDNGTNEVITIFSYH